jgi:hypothetical protein
MVRMTWLLKSSDAKWQDVRNSEYKTFDKAQKDRDLIPTYVQQLIQLTSPDTYYAPLLILRIIVYSVTENSMVGWIKIIRDEDTLNQLISDAFSKVAYLNSCYIEYLNNNYPKYNLETMPLHYAVAGKTFSLLMAMYACRRISIRMGLEKQTDEIFDLLWQFNQDILKFLFPEIEFYKWKFKYGVDNLGPTLKLFQSSKIEKAKANFVIFRISYIFLHYNVVYINYIFFLIVATPNYNSCTQIFSLASILLFHDSSKIDRAKLVNV